MAGIRKKIAFKKSGGPVTIEIESGFSCQGSFILASRKKTIGDEYREFGKPPCRIDDAIPDVYLVPVDPQELENHRVLIVGKYAPAFGKSQISVTYTFLQDGKPIHTTPIRQSLKGTETFLRTEHSYEFVPQDGGPEA